MGQRLLLFVLACAVAAIAIGIAFGEERSFDTYDKHGNRTGVVKETTPGQYDFYDTRGNRLGYGKESPYDRSIQLYDKHWNRTGEAKPQGGTYRGGGRGR